MSALAEARAASNGSKTPPTWNGPARRSLVWITSAATPPATWVRTLSWYSAQGKLWCSILRFLFSSRTLPPAFIHRSPHQDDTTIFSGSAGGLGAAAGTTVGWAAWVGAGACVGPGAGGLVGSGAEPHAASSAAPNAADVARNPR